MCILCGESGRELQLIKKKAIANLVKYFKERYDKRYKSFEKFDETYAHKRYRRQCRSTIETAANEAVEKVSEDMKINKEAKEFDFSSYCFLCDKTALDGRQETR